jgi:hypothetical protein
MRSNRENAIQIIEIVYVAIAFMPRPGLTPNEIKRKFRAKLPPENQNLEDLTHFKIWIVKMMLLFASMIFILCRVITV